MYHQISWDLTVGTRVLFTSTRWVFAPSQEGAVNKVRVWSSGGMSVLGTNYTFENVRYTGISQSMCPLVSVLYI